MATMVEQAKMELAYRQPFFASLLLRRKLVETRDIPTACVDSDGVISYNPDFFAKLSRWKIEFILAHEIMHIVCMHLWRKGHRDPKLWNIAGDYYINSFLQECYVGIRPEAGLFKEGSHNFTTEQIYDSLKQEQDKGGKGEGQDQDPLAGDIRIKPGMTEAQIRDREAMTRLEIASAAEACRSRGRMPYVMKRLLDEILNPKTPWHEILAKYFAGFSSQTQSWARPNRRFEPYLPSVAKEPSMGTVVIGIDTSGSISPRELQLFGGHINAIFEQCKPEKVIVIYCDSEVSHVDKYTKEEYPVELHPYGGGGTDMTKILKYVEEQEINPDVCCILTDGYTPYGNAPFPVVWAITTDKTSPYGETVNIEFDEE